MLRRVIFAGVLLTASAAGCSPGGGARATPALSAASSLFAPADLQATARRPVELLTTDSGASKHVKTWAYWGQPTEPAGVNASYIAAHVTFLEADPTHVAQFHNAGGTYGVKYTDPSRVIPARHEDLWNVPESGWFHDSGGRRIYTNFPGYGTQNMLNPEMAVTRNAWIALTKQIAASAPYNYVEADNTYYDLVGAFYQFSSWGVEAGSQTAYDNGISQLLDSSAVRPIVNGLSNEDGGLGNVSGTTLFLPHSAGGINNEGCLQATYVKSVPQWEFDANTILYTAAQHKWSVCWPQSTQTSDAHHERLFFLGSWWLTYDPTYSVAFPQFASHSGLFVFPEYAIVPLDPIQTAASHVAELRTSGGVYVREFARCYQTGTAIGPCAAFVNPSTTALARPARAAAYKNAVVLDANNAYDGGQVHWSANSATTIAAKSALVVAGLTTNATPPPSPRPTATPGGSAITLYGTISDSTPTSLLLQSSCGYEYVYYTGSTPIARNGYSLAAGTNVRVVGTGSCSTSVTAAQIALTGTGLTVNGSVVSTATGEYVVQTNGSCGNVPVYVTSSTVYQGGTPRTGSSVGATGSGSCAKSITATSITTR